MCGIINMIKRLYRMVYMKTKKLTLMSMLLALALVIFVIEAALPPLTSVPGIKMGLANIITLIALAWLGRKEAFTILILRIILGAVFTGNMMSIIYSLSGGLLCFIVMSAIMGKIKRVWAVSVCGAIAHNIAQIIAAVAVTGVVQVAMYLPVLVISGAVTGIFTGVIADMVIRRKDVILR